MFQTKFVQKIKIHILCSVIFPKKQNLAVYEVKWKNMYSRTGHKNSIKEEIRLRIQAGNRSLFTNKKRLTNKDLNAASKLPIHKSIIRLTVT